MAKSVSEQTGIPDAFGEDFTLAPGYSGPLEAGNAILRKSTGKLKGPLADVFKTVFEGIGSVAPSEVAGKAIEKAAPAVGEWFVRGAFIFVGVVSLGVGLAALVTRGGAQAVVKEAIKQ